MLFSFRKKVSFLKQITKCCLGRKYNNFYHVKLPSLAQNVRTQFLFNY